MVIEVPAGTVVSDPQEGQIALKSVWNAAHSYCVIFFPDGEEKLMFEASSMSVCVLSQHALRAQPHQNPFLPRPKSSGFVFINKEIA